MSRRRVPCLQVLYEAIDRVPREFVRADDFRTHSLPRCDVWGGDIIIPVASDDQIFAPYGLIIKRNHEGGIHTTVIHVSAIRTPFVLSLF